MKLLRQNDKIVLYDDVKDQYIQVEPDDLDHILNDNNELYDDETIRHYFNFKLGKYQIKNQKGYQSKKANLKEEYKQQMTQTQKNYLINQFLSGIYGLSDNDKLMFIKNPTLSTIKKFSVDEQSKNKLIDKFEKINKSYITFKDEGNDIDDMINYYNKNNVPVEVPQVVKASIYKKIEEYENDEIDQYQFNIAIDSYRDKFNNPAKPNAFNDFKKFILRIITNKEATRKTPIEPKPKDDKKPTETKEIKENKDITEAEEILNDVLPDNKINKIFFAKDFGNNNEAAEKANNLNKLEQLTTKSLFSDSTFNEYNDNYFAQNSKFYRIFKYLTDKNLLNDYEVKTTDDDMIKEVILNLKDDNGQIKINIDKNQFLGDKIEEVLKNNLDIDEIFKNNNNIDMIKSKSNYRKSKPYEYINEYKDKNINELIKNKELDKVLDTIENDISNYEFATLIDDYYENYDDDDEMYIDPTIKFNEDDNYNYMEKFNNRDKTLGENSKAYQRLFKVLPRSVIGDLSPKDILKWAHDKVFKYVKDYDQKINNKEREIYDLSVELGDIIKDLNTQKEKLKELEDNYADKGKFIERDQKEIDEQEKTVDDLQEKHDKLKNDISETQRRIDEMKEIKGKNFKDDEDFKEYIKLTAEQIKKIPEKYQDTINDILADYATDILMENLYYTDKSSTIERQSDMNPRKKTIEPTLLNVFKKRNYLKNQYEERKNQLIKDLNSAGSWSYDVLKRIDNLNNILKSSGSWSYDVLKRIDNLNNILKSSGSWSYDVLKRIDNLNELINN